MAERLGNRAINPKVAGLIPGRANDVVSLSKALHLPRENVPSTYCKSLWIRESAKCKCTTYGSKIWIFAHRGRI